MKLRLWAGPVLCSVLLVSGCAGTDLTPGTASVVNGTRITDTEVDDLADAQCVAADRAAKSGQSTSAPVSRVKQQSLGLLMDSELSAQYAAAEGIKATKTTADGFYKQLEPAITPLPEPARTKLEDVFKKWADGRAILVEAGAKETGQAPSPTNLDQLITEGLKARTVWMKKAEIHTDPRYAPTKDGFPGGRSGSVSVASSTFAKNSVKPTPDPAYVSGLPANQKCG